MWGGLVRALALVAVLFAAAARAEAQPVVNNDFFQSDLRQALEDIAVQANVNIILDPTVQGVVTVTIRDASVDKALDLLLAGTPYRVQRTKDYYLVYSVDATSELLTNVSTTKVVSLTHLSPEAARALLAEPLRQYVRFVTGAGSRLAITAPPDIMQRILADLQEIDQPTGDTIFVTLKNIGAEQARSLLPENLQIFVRADQSRNILSITAPGNSARMILRQLEELDKPGPALALAPPDVYDTRIIKLNHVPVKSLLNILPASVEPFIRSDEASNTIAISAPDHIAKKIALSVAQFDVPRQHIMLEARIVVMDKSDGLNFGGDLTMATVEAGFNRSSTGNDYEISVGYLRTQTFTNALTLALNLMSQNDEATIVANPQVLAQDGVPAEIKVTREEYIQIDAVNNGLIRGQLERIETGTILNITPTVGSNGVLTLKMDLEVSDVISRGSQGLPVVSRRTAKSTIQIQNGGTATVAGLVDSRSQIGDSGTPGLRNLPLIGRMFRTDTLRHDARQVAIFVTATLVDADGNRLNPKRRQPRQTVKVDEETFRAELDKALTSLGVVGN
jgi:type II secretory pathway component GspD/PulD (secretin)